MASNDYISSVNKPYFINYILNSSLLIEATKDVINKVNQDNRYTYSYTSSNITVTAPNGDTTDVPQDVNEEGTKTIILNQSGTYRIQYHGRISRAPIADGFPAGHYDYSISFYIAAIRNYLPLKQWTVTDVINRLLDVCEPIRKGEKPRFRLNAEQAVKFDKILSPQFSFTRQTLRECLQDIGNFVHAEARLRPVKDDSGQWLYEVYYEMYTKSEDSGLFTRPYANKGVKHSIESYTGWIDTHAQNLINVLDEAAGVVKEPYAEGAKTVRTENLYARIQDDNMLIATQYPIYDIKKLEYVYLSVGLNGLELKSVDITPYVFEKSAYDSRLSSYDGAYPYSRSYAVYFAQGSRNIMGLSFRATQASEVAEVFKTYSILNIIRQAMNNSSYTVENYPNMAFRVTYTPIYSARVAQTKTNYKDFPKAAALIYNQTANLVESRYYGENLKGAVARLGNIDLSLTYVYKWVRYIPKAGQMFNKDYYIAAVAVELLPTYIRVTVGLSKDFNRLSQYIGINSEKRYSEISEKQAAERNTLWREYIVVGGSERADSDSLIGTEMMKMIMQTFSQNGAYTPISNVCAWGESYKGDGIPAVSLPVISSAFGNSMSFSWEYEDNYSAGAVSSYQKNDNVDGYFQNNAPYTDYYGRIFYYHFDLQTVGEKPNAVNLITLGRQLPQSTKVTQSSGFISTAGKTPYILRKDNREKLQCNFQIDFVTNRENFIIGSALAAYCPAVRGQDKTLTPLLYILPTELNKFTDHIEAYDDIDLSALPNMDVLVSIDNQDRVVLHAVGPNPNDVMDTFIADGKSWAIVTAQTEEDGGNVEDEFGNISKRKIIKGGDLLIGQNMEVKKGRLWAPVYFTKKREIFDKTVWKDKR